MLRFARATPADDPAIRRLLRDNPMRGAISVSFEREPEYFRGANLAGSRDETILAFEHDRLVCMGRCSTRVRTVNGAPRRVGYLGELRLDASVAGRIDIVRGGYRFFRELQRDDAADLYFTSIAADNERARRVLERGLPGMPRYGFLSEYVTLLVPVRGRAMSPRADEVRAEDALSLLNSEASRHQLAAQWTASDLTACGEFSGIRENGRLVAAAALWDRRDFRQTVIRGYTRTLSFARPAINLANLFFGGPRLPRVGAVLAHACVSPLAHEPGREELVPQLVEAMFPAAAERGIELLTLGFAAGDARLSLLRRRFRCREYRSRLYRVSWPGDAPICDERILDGRAFLPEVALL